jgi:hypothetical protein
MGFAIVCFIAAFSLGIPLVMVGGWPIVGIGLVSLLLAYGYTGGPFPLAYLGLGDLFVVIFFGLIAVGGVFFLHVGGYLFPAVIAGLQVGFLATVLIAINNLRDLDQDLLVNKKTLAVRLGPVWGRYEVVALFLGAFFLNFYWLHLGFTFAFALPWLAAVGIGAAKFCETYLEETPRVAYLSFSTLGSAEDDSVTAVRQAVSLARKKAPGLSIEGEWQADTALVDHIAHQKGATGPDAGRANVLVFPDLNAGNIAYKLVQHLGGARAVGPFLVGLAKPMADLSRGCTDEDIVDTVAVTAGAE